jgi:prepilin-type N-terminal cleavage/methylation domain-containing protein
MLSAKSSCNSRGFSLIEVIISMALLTTVSLGVAQIFAASTRMNYVARGQTSTTAMAEQKLEQLRGLTWGFDLQGQGLPLSDTTTNLTVFPPTANGNGLNPSPSDSLDQNTSGYVDFLDSNGTWVGTGTTPPGSAMYIRRWRILPLPTNPNNTLVLQVLVTPVATEAARGASGSPRMRLPTDALLTTVKTRKAS